MQSRANVAAVATVFPHTRLDGDGPVHQFVGVMPIEIRQEIGCFGVERVGEEWNETRRNIAAACFPIRQHMITKLPSVG